LDEESTTMIGNEVGEARTSPLNTEESILEGSVRAMLAKDLMKSKNLDDALRVMGVDERLGMEKGAGAAPRKQPANRSQGHISAEEKQALSRQRNRENARATRKRRKVYVQRLQQLITDLSSNLTAMQQAAARKKAQESKEKGANASGEEGSLGLGKESSSVGEPKAPSNDAMNAARCAAAQKFFQMRSDGVTDKEEWAKLIANPNSFVLTSPPLPFRKYDDFEKSGQFYRCRGVDGLISDTAVLETAMARIAATRAKLGPKSSCTCKASYTADSGDMLVGMDKLMCKWQAVYTFDVDGKDLKMKIMGMCKCRFSLDNLLLSVDLRFDVQGLIQQLEAAMPQPRFPVMPMAMPAFPNPGLPPLQAKKQSNSPKSIASLAPAAIAPIKSAADSSSSSSSSSSSMTTLAIPLAPAMASV
jgi:hypothetical protein